MINKGLLLLIVVVVSTSAFDLYRDISDQSRKENFVKTKLIKKLLERVVSAEDYDLGIDFESAFKSKTPEGVIKSLLSNEQIRAKVNNSIRLLCMENKEGASKFDFDVYVEQTLVQDDLDLGKAVFYVFREVYFIWATSKSVEALYSHTKINELPNICSRDIDMTNPSKFFLDNENKLTNIFIEQLPTGKLKGEAFPGFKIKVEFDLTIDEEDTSDTSNVTNKYYKALINNKYYPVNKSVEIEFARSSTTLHVLSPFLYHVIPQIKNDVNDQLRQAHSGMLISSSLSEILYTIFFENFGNTLSNLFKGDFTFYYFSNLIIDSKNKSTAFTSFSENDKDSFYASEIGMSVQFLVGEQRKYSDAKFNESAESAVEEILGKTVYELTKSNNYIKALINNSNYKLETDLNGHNDINLTDKLNRSAHSDDKQNTIECSTSLLYYRKAITELEKLIENLNTERTITSILVSNVSFRNLIHTSLHYQPNKGYNTILAHLYDVSKSLNKKLKLTFKESFIVFLVKVRRILSINKKYFTVFDVFTSNYNNYLENAKFLLYKTLALQYEDFQDIISLLNSDLNIKATKPITLIGLSSSGEDSESKKAILNSINAFSQFLATNKSVFENKAWNFESKLKMLRNLFYSFYYNGSVPNPEDEYIIETLGNKIIYSDFFRNSQYLNMLAQFFADITDTYFKNEKLSINQISNPEGEKIDL